MTHLKRLSVLAAAVVMTGSAQDVSIRAGDGYQIAATYLSPGKPGPAAVIFRNCDQRRASVTGLAERLRAAGFHVLAYDYRDGLAPGKSWRETRESDMADAHTWLVTQPGVDSTRLVALGGSCGVEMAMSFAQRFKPHVRGAVLMSGPSRPDQHAFIREASPWLAILGIQSIPEGAPGNIDDPVKSSANPETRKLVLQHRAHGTFMLDSAATADSTLAWLRQRVRR